MPPGVGIRVRTSGSLVKRGQSASHCGEETKREVFLWSRALSKTLSVLLDEKGIYLPGGGVGME